MTNCIYGVWVVVGADVGHPVSGWAKGGRPVMTHEAAVNLADSLRERGYTAYVKRLGITQAVAHPQCII